MSSIRTTDRVIIPVRSKAVIVSNSRLQNRTNNVALNKVSLPFKGSLLPGKFSAKELRELGKAGHEIDNWNERVLKAREEATENRD